MSPVALRLLVVTVLVVVVAVAGWWWNRRDGRVRTSAGDHLPRIDAHHLDAVGLEVADGDLGAVLLGSPTCAPCVTVERILTELAADRPGFRWVKVDAADHLPLTEAHKVLRVPTLLVVDRERRVLARTSGVPDASDLAAVLDGRDVAPTDAAA